MENNILNMIGNTPLIRLNSLEERYYINARLFAKLEFLNPFGSIKDRAALQIINDSEANGLLHKGVVLIEATSGNLGVSLSAISAIRGYKAIMVMPEGSSDKKISLMREFGAKTILTPKNKGMCGAIEKAREMARCFRNSYYTDQFNNISSITAHKTTTAPEIQRQVAGQIDYVIAGIGSGGTVTGIGEYFKSFNKEVKIVGVLPKAYPHDIQGIGAGFEPNILNKSVIDEIIHVKDEEAKQFCTELSLSEGIFAGISSGAVLVAAKRIANRVSAKGKSIVMIFADSGERYI